MKKLLTLLLLAMVGIVQGQTITNIIYVPAQANECDPVNIYVQGTYPGPNYQATGFNISQNGNNITIALTASGGGGGGTTMFIDTLPPYGPLVAGSYTVTATKSVNGAPPVTFTNTLVVNPAPIPDPGMDTFLEVCNAGPVVPLLSFMDGTPDPGGSWLDPNGLPHGPNFTPGVDPQGVYTYFFDQTAPCIDTSAILFLNYLPNGNPGVNTAYSICSTDGPVNLFNVLNGNPQSGGTWSGPGGFTSGTYDPAVHQSGNYVYSVPGIAPCPSPSATVTVTENNPPNAGVDGVALICENDTTQDLFDFLTGAPLTGTWIDPLGFPFGTGDSTFFFPGLNFEGNYSYVVTAAPCIPDTAVVTVSVVPLPCGIGIGEVDPNLMRFELMPNPTDGRLTYALSLGSNDAGMRIQVLDTRGTLLMDRALGQVQGANLRGELDLSDLSAGTYLVRLTTTTGVTVKRVVLR